MRTRSRGAVVAVTVLLLGTAGPTLAARDRPRPSEVRRPARSEARHLRPHRPVKGRHPIQGGAAFWWTPAAPPPPAAAASLVVLSLPPVALPPEPPPPPIQRSYYWYACGAAGRAARGQEPPAAYCLGGLRPSQPGTAGPGKSLAQFQADDQACQRRASAQAATLPGVTFPGSSPGGELVGASEAAAGTVQGRYDLAYGQCMAALGNPSSVTGTRSPGYGATSLPPPPGPANVSSALPPPPPRSE